MNPYFGIGMWHNVFFIIGFSISVAHDFTLAHGFNRGLESSVFIRNGFNHFIFSIMLGRMFQNLETVLNLFDNYC
jgi:hypothetical protein